MVKKIDKIDIINIKNEAAKLIQVNTFLRDGQTIFIAASKLFKVSSDKLVGTDYDCFYEDSRIDKFLDKLLTMDAE